MGSGKIKTKKPCEKSHSKQKKNNRVAMATLLIYAD